MKPLDKRDLNTLKLRIKAGVVHANSLARDERRRNNKEWDENLIRRLNQYIDTEFSAYLDTPDRTLWEWLIYQKARLRSFANARVDFRLFLKQTFCRHVWVESKNDDWTSWHKRHRHCPKCDRRGSLLHNGKWLSFMKSPHGHFFPWEKRKADKSKQAYEKQQLIKNP